MQEKRKFTRFKAPFCVQCAHNESSREVPGVIKDLSYGGVRVLLDTSYDILYSSLLSLSILFPENTLRVTGRVVWAKDWGDKKEVGLCFLDLPDSYKQIIYDYASKYFKEEFKQRWWQS